MAQWRVVLNALSEDQEDKLKLKAPTFNDARHNGVCRDVCLGEAINCMETDFITAQISLRRSH